MDTFMEIDEVLETESLHAQLKGDDQEYLSNEGAESTCSKSEISLLCQFYDKNSRRSSLGTESLLDHDINEENQIVDGGTSYPDECQPDILYAEDIFHYKRELEQRQHPKQCVAEQPQITEDMRCVVVNWLVKVSHQLQFGPETVFLAVNIFDRFLACTPVAQDCIQLLAISSLLIAAKMEESSAPSISELESICGDSFRHHHFRRMEILVLSKLRFALLSSSSWYFVEYFNSCLEDRQGVIDRRIFHLSHYVVETVLSNYAVSQYLPSVQAAAAIVTASSATGSSLCSSALSFFQEVFSSREQSRVFKCAMSMAKFITPFLESFCINTLEFDANSIHAFEKDSFQYSCHSESVDDERTVSEKRQNSLQWSPVVSITSVTSFCPSLNSFSRSCNPKGGGDKEIGGDGKVEGKHCSFL